MNDKNIPEGWEPCNPSECTHAFATQRGAIFPVEEHDHISGNSFGPITKTAWPILGIIPIRKATPPKPIEFVVGDDMLEFLKWVDTLPAGVKPGMKFRQVVEE